MPAQKFTPQDRAVQVNVQIKDWELQILSCQMIGIEGKEGLHL